LIAGPDFVGFIADGGSDYGRRLARLRWKRRFPSRHMVLLPAGAVAQDWFTPATDWVVIFDEIALPAPGVDVPAAPGRVLLAAPISPASTPVVHTLRELEADTVGREASGPEESAPAIVFRPSDFPAGTEETVAEYVRRLASPPTPRAFAPGLGAIVFEDSPGGDRADVTGRFPSGIRRLLDVGCGSGRASAALCRSRPGLAVTGIERDPVTAALARQRLHDVREGEAGTALSGLVEAGERFDALLFADVLEHFDDPIGILGLARDLASPGATLVASVPNVGHLSLVRDLVLGRFDPLPAGLADFGHLRWFTRTSLAEALEEAGWTDVTVEATAGAPAPAAEQFLQLVGAWPGADHESLTTYQWIAVARSASP
jgi:2-polyprenyl-3-methyl-5-hydroxy-6-metoxy-1,4-benzoquinol methylase